MLAAEARRDEHKVRSGTSAMTALGLSASSDPVETPSGSMTSSTLSPAVPAPASIPTATAPVDISSRGVAASPGAFRSGSSGRLSFLSACFSPGGEPNERCYTSTARCPSDYAQPNTVLHENVILIDSLFIFCNEYTGANSIFEDASNATPTYEVGIRPSFYWVDGPTTEEQRLETEASLRFLKADCQDEATVIQNFAGIPGLAFIGVFDGHGPYGRTAAKFASDRLPAALAEHVAALRSRSEKKRLKAMREACRVVNTEMRAENQANFDASMSGTTACFALVIGGSRILLANVGDSRCVLARRAPDGTGIEALPLTVDAKPSLPQELRRIEACGGVVRQLLDETGRRRGAHRVFRRGDSVLPGLAMSRSLGDMYAQAVGVTWEPLLSAHSLGPRDLFLIFGTDGLWDVMSPDAAADFVDRYRQRREPDVSCAAALTFEAQERWKAAHDEALVDDISVAILHAAPLPPTAPSDVSGSVLPRQLSRVASCNDEANAISSSWKREAMADDPSHHSPRPFFQHLYRSEGGVGSGDFWEGLQQKDPPRPASPVTQRQHPYRPSTQAMAVPGTSSLPPPSPQDSRRSLRSPSALTARARPVISSALRNPTSAMPVNQDEDYNASQPWMESSFDEEPRYTEEAQERPNVPNFPAMGSSPVIDIPSKSRVRPLGGSGSMPIPTSSTLHPYVMSAPTAAGVLGASSNGDALRPIRKAYLSTTTMHSVPSWDGAFYHSFRSDASLPALAGGDTPRSSGSNDSGRVSGTMGVSRRGMEVHHEGKVHRGVPCSMSVASHGLLSSDSHSEIFSQGTSRGGSIDDAVPGLGQYTSPTLGRSNSIQNRRRIPRSASHSSLMRTGSGFGAPMNAHRTNSGRVVVVKDVHVAMAAMALGADDA